MPSVRNRNWVYTINNPDIVPGENWLEDAEYHTYQLEEGENGTRHFQGYVEFQNLKTLKAMKKYHSKAHWEMRKGKQVQAIEYCKKEDSRIDGPWEFGTRKSQGERSDLEVVREMVVEGNTAEDIADHDFGTWCRNHRAIDRYIAMKAPKRTWETEVFVYTGPTGTGKTRLVHELEENLWTKPDGDWYDGYIGQSAVLIDDFACDMKLTQLLRLTDRYPMDVPVKGNFVNWAPQKIYITSNIPFDHWYSGALPEHRAALRRRITEIKIFE